MQSIFARSIPYLSEETLLVYLVQRGEPENIIGELLRGLFQILEPLTSHGGHQHSEKTRPKAILVSS